MANLGDSGFVVPRSRTVLCCAPQSGTAPRIGPATLRIHASGSQPPRPRPPEGSGDIHLLHRRQAKQSHPFSPRCQTTARILHSLAPCLTKPYGAHKYWPGRDSPEPRIPSSKPQYGHHPRVPTASRHRQQPMVSCSGAAMAISDQEQQRSMVVKPVAWTMQARPKEAQRKSVYTQ